MTTPAVRDQVRTWTTASKGANTLTSSDFERLPLTDVVWRANVEGLVLSEVEAKHMIGVYAQWMRYVSHVHDHTRGICRIEMHAKFWVFFQVKLKEAQTAMKDKKTKKVVCRHNQAWLAQSMWCQWHVYNIRDSYAKRKQEFTDILHMLAPRSLIDYTAPYLVLRLHSHSYYACIPVPHKDSHQGQVFLAGVLETAEYCYRRNKPQLIRNMLICTTIT